MEPSVTDYPNPFAVETDKPVVALKGKRNGYLMLSSDKPVFKYEDIPDEVFAAARAWAAELEKLGAPKVYWMILSEVTLHYHIHIFPRWPEDTLKGIALFEQRESADEPGWTSAVENVLNQWAASNGAEAISLR